MNPLTAALTAVFVLGGVTVGVSPATGVRPSQPDSAAMANVWPTNGVYTGLRVVMDNGQNWIIKKISQSTVDSSTTVEVRPNATTSVNVKVTVQPEDVGTRIWVLTVPYEIPEDIEETPQPLPEPVPTPPAILGTEASTPEPQSPGQQEPIPGL
jgi:alpha-D-ribose 1-methylphosphonate 5-phosphate C-P lyase